MKNIRYISNTLLLTTFISMFVMTSFVQAATTPINDPKYTLLEPLPSIDGTGNSTLQGEISLNTYIIYAVNLFIAIAAVAAVFMIVWGGLLYMTTDSWQGKTDGRKKATDAVIGLLMVLSTYIILKTVNPALVNIPANLVPPIADMKRTSASSLYDELLAEAEQLNTQAQNSVAAAQRARDAISNLQNQLNSAQNDYNTALNNNDFAAMNDASLQITRLNGQIASTTADMAVSNDIGITTNMVAALTNELNQIVSGISYGSFWLYSSEEDINDKSSLAIDQIASTTEKRIAQLQSIPNSTAQIIQVQDQQQYADIQVLVKRAIALQGEYTKNNGTETAKIISKLDLGTAGYLSYIKNADVLKQATDLIASTKTRLKNNIK